MTGAKRQPVGLPLRRALLLGLLSLPARAAAPGGGVDGAIERAIRAILEGEEAPVAAALAGLRQLKAPGSVAPLIQMLFWTDEGEPLVEALAEITGARPGERFFDWMVWQEEHPENAPYGGYEQLLADLLGGLDPAFGRFFRPGVKRTIRVEEIVWGGVKVDAIPALDMPQTVPAAGATWLNPDDRVFGVQLGGEARAYPLRIMNWHEMANDVVGGVPVVLAYCPLCGAGVLYDGRVAGAPAPLTFGSSGLLYRSNKLMYDRITESLWSQFSGRPVMGPLVGAGVELAPLPLVLSRWDTWRTLHPATQVVSVETGFDRDYRSEGVYGAYFASRDLAFPAALRNRALGAKDLVFGVRVAGGAMAWPLARFAGGAVILERVGLVDVVAIGDGETVRAYESEGRRFVRAGNGLRDEEGDWAIEEAGLRGPGGRTLPRVAGHVAYWFAWNGYFPDAGR